MFFLTPKYLKKGRLYIKEAEKRLAYHRDRWSDVMKVKTAGFYQEAISVSDRHFAAYPQVRSLLVA